MLRVQIDSPGGYERLTLREAPDLQGPPAAGHVRIAVHACGVNYADVVVRMGLYASAKTYVGWPITPGFEVAGRVEAVGAGVDSVAVGAEVLAVTRFGGYATQLDVPATHVFARPRGFDTAAAAGFPAVALTAWYAIHELAHPRPGTWALVHSAAGGVGTSLVQLLVRAGVHVVGVVGAAHKVELVRALGADVVIDKSSEPLWPRAAAAVADRGGFDVAFDPNGVATLAGSYAHLRPAGKLVIYGFTTMLPRYAAGAGASAGGRSPRGGRPRWLSLGWDWLRTPRYNPLDLTNHNKSVMAFNLSYLFEHTDLLHEAMAALAGWADEGALRPAPVRMFPLHAVAEAHAALESGQTVGKLVLVTPEGERAGLLGGRGA